METHEGAKTHEHSLDHALEFFSKAGSLFVNTKDFSFGKKSALSLFQNEESIKLFANRKGFYNGEESALGLFQKSWIVNEELTMKLLFWLRDIRGGAGNRSGFRECLNWLGDHNSGWVTVNIKWIPMVGRWDDLRSLFGTASEQPAVDLWKAALLKDDVLAAKWADRKDKPLRYALRMNEAGFRKFLSKIRKEHIVETKMCSKTWKEIDYSNVPSVAMARYSKAFSKNDEERFVEYKLALKDGKETVHADVLFPHDCVRTARNGDGEIANAQFDALPNFMEDTGDNIVVIADTSGSMDVPVAGEIRAVDISQALALYCSSKIPKDNPFHKKFIAFCDEGHLQSWDGMLFSAAIRNRRIFDHAVGATRIDQALNTLLEYAMKRQVKDIPTVLLIVSDMQFSQGCSSDNTPVENALQDWDDVGFKRPRIVYWNTAGYAGSPDTVRGKDVAMVSGFSTGILKAILGGEDFSPKAVMLRALDKYKVENPLFGDFADI